MKDIITILQDKKQEVITELKAGNTNNQSLISQLDKAISWLAIVEQYQLDMTNRYDIQVLPDTAHGMSFFHLMIDCESSDSKDWVEYAPNNSPIEMSIGDIIMVRK